MRFECPGNETSLDYWKDRGNPQRQLIEGRLLSPEGTGALNRILNKEEKFVRNLLPEIERHLNPHDNTPRVLTIGSPTEISIVRDHHGRVHLREKILLTPEDLRQSGQTFLVNNYCLLPYRNETYFLAHGTFGMRSEQTKYSRKAMSPEWQLSGRKVDDLLARCDNQPLKQAS